MNSFKSGRTQFCGLSTFINAYAIRGGAQFTSKTYAIKSHILRLLSMIHSCFSQGLPRLFLVVTVSEIQLVCFKALVKLFITFNGATARSNQYDLNALLHLTDYSILYCIFSIHVCNLQQHTIIRKLVLMTALILLI